MPLLLIRYGEIGLKSTSVRRRFEAQLVDDVRRRHALAGVPCVISQSRGRVFLDSDDWKRSCEILTRTFGIVSFSPTAKVSSALPELTKDVVEFAKPLVFKGASFAIRSRRSGNHPYTSQSLAASLGDSVLKAFPDLGLSVDLEEPDVEISVEVREKEAYLFSSVLAGPGGMPLGSQGRALMVVSTARGLASAWLMMKRGCSAVVATDDPGRVEPLAKWYPNLKTTGVEDDLFAVAAANGCIGIALEWSLKEIQSRGPLKGDLPVFYPLVGMDENDTKGLLDRIVA